jgi:hypothetical protein
MRADKPGQARVFSADGSEYSAGAARWLQAELLRAEKNCREGKFVDAGEHVATVRAAIIPNAKRQSKANQ